MRGDRERFLVSRMPNGVWVPDIVKEQSIDHTWQSTSRVLWIHVCWGTESKTSLTRSGCHTLRRTKFICESRCMVCISSFPRLFLFLLPSTFDLFPGWDCYVDSSPVGPCGFHMYTQTNCSSWLFLRLYSRLSQLSRNKSRAYTPAEQTTTAISAVRDALDNLDQLFGTIEDTYRTSLMSSGIEREPAPTSGASSRKEFSA